MDKKNCIMWPMSEHAFANDQFIDDHIHQSPTRRVFKHYLLRALPDSIQSTGQFFTYCWEELPHVQNAIIVLFGFVAFCFITLQVIIPGFARIVFYPPTSEDLLKEGKDLLQKYGTSTPNFSTRKNGVSAWEGLYQKMLSFRVLRKFQAAIKKDPFYLEAYIALATEEMRQEHFPSSLSCIEQGLDTAIRLKSNLAAGKVVHELLHSANQIDRWEKTLKVMKLEVEAMAEEKQEGNARNQPRRQAHSLAHQINIGQFEGIDGYRPVLDVTDILSVEQDRLDGRSDFLLLSNQLPVRCSLPHNAQSKVTPPQSKVKEK